MDLLRPYASQLLAVLRIMSGLLLLAARDHEVSECSRGAHEQRLAHDHERAGRPSRLLGARRPADCRPVYTAGRASSCRAYRGRLLLCAAPRGFFPILDGGELAALYCFVLLFLAAAGGVPGAPTSCVAEARPSFAQSSAHRVRTPVFKWHRAPNCWRGRGFCDPAAATSSEAGSDDLRRPLSVLIRPWRPAGSAPECADRCSSASSEAAYSLPGSANERNLPP